MKRLYSFQNVQRKLKKKKIEANPDWGKFTMSGSSVNFHQAEPESIIAQQSSLWSPVRLINRAPFTGKAGDSWAKNLHRGGGEATWPRHKTLTLRILTLSSLPAWECFQLPWEVSGSPTRMFCLSHKRWTTRILAHHGSLAVWSP